MAPQPFFSLRGACLAHLQALKALSSLGLKIDVITFPGGEDPGIPGVRLFRLPSLPGLRRIPIGFSWRKLLLDAVMGAVLIPCLAAGRYDIVHASEDSAALASVFKLFFRFRLVYDMDDILSLRLAQAGVLRSGWALGLARVLERWVLRSADLVVVNGLSTARYAVAAVGAHRVLSYDHMPFDEHGVPQAGDAGLRRTWDLEGRKIILYAGNMEPYQGVELLIDSLPSVCGRLAEASCVIVGGEPAQIESLRRRAQRLGIADRMRWLGQRPFPETFQLMRQADVLVSPMTQTKAVPMKLYAYAAAGRPIVATALPNNTELLDQDTAVLVAPDPRRMAEGILRILEDGALSKRLADNARGLARRCADRSVLDCLRAQYLPNVRSTSGISGVSRAAPIAGPGAPARRPA